MVRGSVINTSLQHTPGFGFCGVLCHLAIAVLLSADICQAIEPKVPFYKLGGVRGDLKPPTFKGSRVERVPCIKTSRVQEQRTRPSALPWGCLEGG